MNSIAHLSSISARRRRNVSFSLFLAWFKSWSLKTSLDCFFVLSMTIASNRYEMATIHTKTDVMAGMTNSLRFFLSPPNSVDQVVFHGIMV